MEDCRSVAIFFLFLKIIYLTEMSMRQVFTVRAGNSGKKSKIFRLTIFGNRLIYESTQ